MSVKILDDGTQVADFQYDFALETKSVTTEVDENGDLWIEGYASDFGVDRQDEAFEPGAFSRGLQAFLATNPIMLYHHQYDKALGQFVDARIDDNGLWVKGRVDSPAAGSWAEDVFNKIRKGTIKAFSVGGIFKRRKSPDGQPRIYEADLGEISVTPFPVNPRTTFSVVAKKAFEGKAEGDDTSPKEDPRENEIGEEQKTGVEATPAEPAPEQEGEEQKEIAEEEAEAVVEEEAELITSEKIAPASITTEHLADDLRSRFQELTPEAPTLENLGQALDRLDASLNAMADHVGYRQKEPITE